MNQLLLVKVPKSQSKTVYNIAQKAGVKLSVHTHRQTAFILIIVEKTVLNCNLLQLPAQMHGVYRFFDELRKRKFEYTLEVYTLNHAESLKRNELGVFDLKQPSLF